MRLRTEVYTAAGMVPQKTLPYDTIPICKKGGPVGPSRIKGPPESPEQESFPTCPPAHN